MSTPEEPILPYRQQLNLIRQGLAPKTTGPKKKKPIPRFSQAKLSAIKAEREVGSDGEMDKFFEAMLKRCTGKCLFCNGSTSDIKLWRIENEKISKEANEKNWERKDKMMKRIAIAHLLPKRPVYKGGFPSVATNESNWIELCWSCHTSFDSGKISFEFLKDSKEWEIISEKLLAILPLTTPEERKHKLYSKLIKLVYEK